ncbi:telomerase protein component 1-like [Thalassophryne amazonica]|uniref:telomerase protein component 1-like n=1 Tax=Thalassophryne amazonica TaxID=390379 RepID=UPI00147121BE|nr:telomerase protein component 1-like [Thalassophryne amazonica]
MTRKSLWLAGESECEVHLAFMIPMGPNVNLSGSFGTVHLSSNEPLEKRSLLTAVSVDGELVVCGDIKGNMWFIQPPYTSSWSNKKPAHSSRISVLKVTGSTIISASHDGTVKLWDRNTKKQVGMFVCGSPVLVLEVNPQKPNELVCGDEQGKVYFLTWQE